MENLLQTVGVRILMRGASLQVRKRVVRLDAAAVNYDDALAHRLHLLHYVG